MTACESHLYWDKRKQTNKPNQTKQNKNIAAMLLFSRRQNYSLGTSHEAEMEFRLPFSLVELSDLNQRQVCSSAPKWRNQD